MLQDMRKKYKPIVFLYGGNEQSETETRNRIYNNKEKY